MLNDGIRVNIIVLEICTLRYPLRISAAYLSIVLVYVLFVCRYVLYYCNWVSTQNHIISYHIITYHIISYHISNHIINWNLLSSGILRSNIWCLLPSNSRPYDGLIYDDQYRMNIHKSQNKGSPFLFSILLSPKLCVSELFSSHVMRSSK